MSDRYTLLTSWLVSVLGSGHFELTPASSDASLRRYWRLVSGGASLIAMDAPPEHEDCGRFADLSRRLRAIGISTPEIQAEDRSLGFLLISDFGDRLYLDELCDETVEGLYGDALDTLAVLQARGPSEDLPRYDDAFLRRELDLFRDWLLGQQLGLRLNGTQQAVLAEVGDILVASALEQPRVFTHRDFHSRNLMVLDSGSPGVLDFQDAVIGPITYDLVSLLRDCYISWPEERVVDWALGYLRLAERSGILANQGPGRFLRWLDLMGMQRHLKACGIFARLNRRDGKPGYLADIPRTLGYVSAVAARYPELAGLSRLLDEQVWPRLESLSLRPAASV